MEVDDPSRPEFASWDSFNRFARRVRHKRRFVLTPKESAFLATVRATNYDRDVELDVGTILYRAQQGIDWHMRKDEAGNELGEEPIGFAASRMKPRVNQATEGRANPAGIPFLYLGTSEQVVISEVRPWVGTYVSVAQFRILRTLKAIDLSRHYGLSSFREVGLHRLSGRAPVSIEEKAKAVWIDIDNAFSRPVTKSDDTADYVPTQILAELFKDSGYDAIIYRSNFSVEGFNVALFNPENAEPVSCAPYEVKTLEVTFEEIGNRWYKK